MFLKRWYIWLSFPAFIVLYLETLRIVNPDYPFVVVGIGRTNKTLLLLSRHIIFSFLILFAFPLVAMLIGFNKLAVAIPGFENVISWIRNIFIYLQGVYMTYRLCKWREKNIAKNGDIPKYDSVL